MIKPLCKECGGRHWSHELHCGAASRSNEEIMGAGRFAKPIPKAPVADEVPEARPDHPPASEAVAPAPDDPPQSSPTAIEKRKSYAREYQRKLREQRKKDRQA